MRASHAEVFFVENVEGPETDVGEFLFAEVDLRAECGIARRHIGGRVGDSRCVCAAPQGHGRAYSSGNRRGLLQLVLIWLPLCPGHDNSSHTLRYKLRLRTPWTDSLQDGRTSDAVNLWTDMQSSQAFYSAGVGWNPRDASMVCQTRFLVPWPPVRQRKTPKRPGGGTGRNWTPNVRTHRALGSRWQAIATLGIANSRTRPERTPS